MSDWFVARGDDAGRWVPRGLDQRLELGSTVVAWRSDSPWIKVATDEQRWVLVDGRFHPSGHDDAAWALEACNDPLWLRRTKGDFVALVADLRAHHVRVARDPIGARPCFWAALSERFAASSTQRNLAATPWVDTRPDPHTIAEMLAGPLGHGTRTVHEGIRRLLPGTAIEIPQSGTVRTRPTRPLRIDRRRVDWDETVGEVRTLFDAAVNDRLANAGPTAFEVSGGLDSSSVAVTGRRMTDDALLGRMVFDDERADERRYSDAVANQLSSPIIDAPAFVPSTEWLDRFAAEWRVPPPPPNGSMALGLHHVFAARSAATVLTGLGGDDAFAAQAIGPRVLSAMRTGDRAELARLGRWALARPGSLWPKLLRPTLGELAWRRRQLPTGLTLITTDVREELDLVRRVVGPASRDTGDRAIDERSEMLREGWITRVLEMLALVGEEGGVRLSHPYFDIDVIEATYGLDPSWPKRTASDRSLQRAALGPRLPNSVRHRTSKAEFSATAWASITPAALDDAVCGPLSELGAIDRPGLRQLAGMAKRQMPGSVIPASTVILLDRWLRSAT